MAALNIDVKTLDAVLITHEHSDHIMGLKTFAKNVVSPIYATNGTGQAIKANCEYITIKAKDQLTFETDENETIGVEVIKLSHDANEPVGFIFTYMKKKLIHLTDTGYVLNENIEKTANADVYLIESNYEDDVLITNNKYPFKTKQRILSEKGHLSNKQCNEYLQEVISPKTQHVLFAHLSANNNTKELVMQMQEDVNVPHKVALDKTETVSVDICK